MVSDLILALQQRTDAKVRYARVHLEELVGHEPLGGDDFDRAHQESFLYHLLGIREAFLVELNAYYLAGVAPRSLSAGSLRKALEIQGKSSGELNELYLLEKDQSSWYGKAKRMRDHATHIGGVSRAYHLGGQKHNKVLLRVPGTDEITEQHFPLEFRDWLSQMESLLARLRGSAVKELPE